MNLMPIVELESFFATAATAAAPPTLEPLLSGTALFGCCSDGVLFLGLDEPGFHILSAIAIVVVDGMNDVVVVLDDGFWVAARGQHFLAGAQKIRREPERYGGNSKDMAGTKFNFKDMAGTPQIWREPQRYGGNEAQQERYGGNSKDIMVPAKSSTEISILEEDDIRYSIL